DRAGKPALRSRLRMPRWRSRERRANEYIRRVPRRPPPEPACPMTIDNVNRRRNLGFFFDQSVARAPDKVAIIDLFGGKERRATYRQLDARMNAVASMLARLGVVPGERVAMVIGNRTEFLEFFFGSMRAGAIPLPLNIRLAAPTLAQMITDAQCALA